MINLNYVYYGLLWTLCSITFLYNTTKSLVSHKTNASVASVLKTAFNFSGLVRAVIMLGKIVAPTPTLMHECSGAEHVLVLANALFRLNLAGFLLWRLKQVDHRKFDRYIATALFALTTAFQLMHLGFFKSTPHFDEKLQISYCVPMKSTSSIVTHWAFVVVDFIIDIFVTVRLLLVLNVTATNLHHEVLQPRKHPLFCAIVSWNSLRLGLAFIYHVLSAINAKYYDQINPDVTTTMFVIIYSALSCIITHDREIVHAIDQGVLPFAITEKSRAAIKIETVTQRVSEEQRAPLLSVDSENVQFPA